MKANTEFFETLRTEIRGEYNSDNANKSVLNISELFAGCGCINQNDASFVKAIAIIEAQINVYEAEIESLKADNKTLIAEKVVVKSEIEKQHLLAEAVDMGITKEEWKRRVAVPMDVIDKWDKGIESEMSRAEYDSEEYHNEIQAMISNYMSREMELREALKAEKEKNKDSDGIEKLPISDFIDYAEQHYPADQNKSAKILKEAILDLYDRRRVSDEDYERIKNLGTKYIPTSVNVGAGGINVQQANNVGK